ncbi:MAG TPA: PIN domain-containing protein [Cellvibrionaceae bacterium]|nr:PIN domain-containing protein [Cellvibrionaceae bacterium]HMW71334.1 PIN domain-containing protein [Cellvibrionaceae bacterium]HMY40635.1 PIN domain-containing protein [Marinagarivorans sp.]HNG61670.1 PIN domain-containing protein [Cellvibrionaceae bacterium]
MKGILVDTCVWSIALRGGKAKDAQITEALTQLIDDNQAKIIGVIRQELLSGYSDKQSYERLKAKLKYFPNEPILDSDYETAAEYANFCRTKGIQGSHTDYLICAVAIRARLKIFTTDKDFSNYSKHLPIAIYQLK